MRSPLPRCGRSVPTPHSPRRPHRAGCLIPAGDVPRRRVLPRREPRRSAGRRRPVRRDRAGVGRRDRRRRLHRPRRPTFPRSRGWTWPGTTTATCSPSPPTTASPAGDHRRPHLVARSPSGRRTSHRGRLRGLHPRRRAARSRPGCPRRTRSRRGQVVIWDWRREVERTIDTPARAARAQPHRRSGRERRPDAGRAGATPSTSGTRPAAGVSWPPGGALRRRVDLAFSPDGSRLATASL